MDERFDRRELLLHLGEMLEASNWLSRTAQPDIPVAQLAEQESLLDFEFLRMVAPVMTAAEFGTRIARAFFLWPKELLETDLNREVLASTVRHDLFDRNPSGWEAYVAHMQKKVKWFGAGLPAMNSGALDEPARDAAGASAVEASVRVAPSVEWDAPDEKRGWPWRQPGWTS